MSKTWNYQVAGTINVSTTGNINDLDFQKCSVIRMTNASLSTIRGLKAGYPGQKITIISTGAGQVDFANQHAGSVAANRLINFVTLFDTPLAAGKGNATYQYDDTTSRWRLTEHNQGDVISIPYAAGNFTGSGGMTWGVDLADQRSLGYFLENTKVTVIYYIGGSSVTAPLGNTLKIALPTGMIATIDSYNTIWYLNPGAVAPAFCRISIGGTNIEIIRLDSANMAASVNDTYAAGTLIFAIG